MDPLKCLSSRRRGATLSLALAFSMALAAAQTPSAFPGAVGFGAAATGGRGGTIYHVTNLNDQGPGSFRDAVSAGGRIVVFDVGGYIVLQSPVSVSSDITIEGQTAPGGGIGVMAAEVSFSNKTNIIVRGMRFRQGTQDPDTGKSAVNMGDGSNIIFDHCSFEYGQWDSVDAVGAVNVTVQHSIIADPIGQQFGAHVETGPSTFYRNLWVNAHNRQPLAKDNTQYINNVIYDYELGYTAANTGGYFSHDIIDNYFITGPMTTTPSDQFFQMNNKQAVYAAGNMLDSSPDGVLNGVINNVVDQAVMSSTPWAPSTTSIPTASAADAYLLVTAGAGAFPRDEVDQFVLSDVRSLGLNGQLYKDQAVTGIENDGYGLIAGGTPFLDANGDGIPDYWETANGISTTDPNASLADYGNTGYTNLEAYANSLILPAPWSAADLNSPSVQGASSFNTTTGVWLLTGSGGGDDITFDQSQFSSQSWNTDGNLTAEVLAVNGGTGGLMVRSSSNATAAFVALTANSLGQVVFQSRSSDGGTVSGSQLSGITFPVFFKLVRQDATIAGYVSGDNATWRLVGLAPVYLPESALAGMAVASGSSALATAQFQSVTFGTDTGSMVTLTTSTNAVTYSGSLNVTVPVSGANGVTPSGSVQIWDVSTLLTTQPLQGNGTAYWYLQPALSAGTHILTASYTGDSDNEPGFSAPVTISVQPAPVTLSASCWNSIFAYGANYQCTANVSSSAGAPTGTLTESYDGALSSLALKNSSAQWTVSQPDAGTHTMQVAYGAQGNFAASQTAAYSFTVTSAPVQMQIAPSSYYLASNTPFALQAALTTWSAPVPTGGTVIFYDQGAQIGTATIGANGTETLTLPGLTQGQHSFTAAYSGTTNYSAATSQSVNVQAY